MGWEPMTECGAAFSGRAASFFLHKGLKISEAADELDHEENCTTPGGAVLKSGDNWFCGGKPGGEKDCKKCE